MKPVRIAMVYLATFTAFVTLFSPALAQKEPVPAETVSSAVADGADESDRPTQETLRTILDTIGQFETELEGLEREYRSAQTPEQQERISREIQRISDRIEGMERDFETIATGVDLGGLEEKPAVAFDWKKEIQELLGPVLQELKGMTERPRQVERLRREMAAQETQLAIIEKALDNIEALKNRTGETALKNRLAALAREWETRKQQVLNQLTIARYRLEEQEKEKKSLLESTQQLLRVFFRSRGRNLAVSFLAFLLVFLLLRWLHRLIYRLSPLHSGPDRPFYVRLFDVIYHILTFAGSAGAALMVLYVSGDWVLLTIAAIFLFGIAWTARQGLPRYWEQIKMLLNLGAVRENERIVYNGLPWRVKNLNVYTILENPRLTGGQIRLPIQTLMEMTSRPFKREEPWFPCRQEDWIILGDGTFGKVVVQTPEMVRLVKRGGAQQTYQIADFLGLSPLNLSVNFRLKVTFGIDYALQAISVDEVPDKMGAMVKERLGEMGYGKEVLNVRAEFEAASASSLDIVVLADFSGKAAPFYNRLTRAIQRICVEACNLYGWGIPFTQVTVHMADEASDSTS
jgi:hypothetical protein